MDDDILNSEVELFVQLRKMRFRLDILFMSERYRDIINSKQNRCMNSIIVKHPCKLVIFLPEFYLRILTNHLVSISNDILCMEGEYKLSFLREKCGLFWDYSARFTCYFILMMFVNFLNRLVSRTCIMN